MDCGKLQGTGPTSKRESCLAPADCGRAGTGLSSTTSLASPTFFFSKGNSPYELFEIFPCLYDL